MSAGRTPLRRRGARTTAGVARAAALGLAAGVVLAGCDVHPNERTLPGQVATGSDGYTVTVTFERVENLVPNSAVLLDDVTIGTVTEIEVVDWQAEVTLRLLDDVPVPADATFAIGQKTLLGAQYVQVVTPATEGGAVAAGATDPAAVAAGGDLLEDGAVVPVERTGRYPATEQVLAAASLLLNNGGLAQINTITTELNDSLDGRVPDVRSVVARLGELVAVLDENRARMISVLEGLDGLAGDVAAESDRIGQAIDVLAPALEALEEERVPLVAAVTSLGATSVDASELVRTSQEALLGNLASLRPVLEQLSEVGDQVPDALKILVTIPFPVMTSDIAIRGDYANLYATIDVSLPALAERFLGTPLGLDLPFLQQGGDPVLDPLAPGAGAAAPESAAPEAPGDEPGAGLVPDLPVLPAPSSSPSPSPDPGADEDETDGSCNVLSRLLGGCS